MRGLTCWPCVRGNIYEGLQAVQKGSVVLPDINDCDNFESA